MYNMTSHISAQKQTIVLKKHKPQGLYKITKLHDETLLVWLIMWPDSSACSRQEECVVACMASRFVGTCMYKIIAYSSC